MKLDKYLAGVPEGMIKLAAMPGALRSAGQFIAKHKWPIGIGAGLGAAGLGAGLASMGGDEEEEPKDVPLGANPWGELVPRALSGALGTALGAGAAGLGYMAYKGLRRGGQERVHPGILQGAVANDELLQGADPQALQMHFATMARFAPTLATDPSAVQSFLREAVTSGGGINYNTIKLLTEAERIAQEIA